MPAALLQEQQADFARVLDEVRSTCANQRKNIPVFREHASKARAQCRNLQKPWHRRFALEKQNEAEWWDLRASACEHATNPKRVEEKLAPVIVEAAGTSALLLASCLLHGSEAHTCSAVSSQ